MFYELPPGWSTGDYGGRTMLYIPDKHIKQFRKVSPPDEVNELQTEERRPKRKKRTPVTPSMLGEISSYIAKNPRATRAEVAKLFGISEITVKTNAKICRFFDVAQGIAEQEARQKYEGYFDEKE